MDILYTLTDLRAYVRKCRAEGQMIAFVPTMGALHDGHVTLVREGLKRADICIPYIFLNPKQFAPTEDLASYPKTLDADLEKLRAVQASAVYVPSAADIYPEGFATSITVTGISAPLEGVCRPHFFQGVATIVAKMLIQCLPDIALFGEKDYQQLLVIKKLVKDLDLPITIMGVPTVRDFRGLALSSRNVYLSADETEIAVQMNVILKEMMKKSLGSVRIEEAEAWGLDALKKAGFDRVDYCVVRDAQTLHPVSPDTQIRRALAAAWIGTTRLIDNRGEHDVT